MPTSLSNGIENSPATNKSILHRALSAVGILSLLVLSLSFVPVVKAPTAVSIGNGPSRVGGTYLNAQNIADNLVFTSIVVQAGISIDIVDDIDLSSSTYGIPAFNFALIAPTINLN